MRLEDRVRARVRVKGMALTTEEVYVGWYRRYVIFHGKRHPETMGEGEFLVFSF